MRSHAASSPPSTAITTATGTAPSASSVASGGSSSGTPKSSRSTTRPACTRIAVRAGSKQIVFTADRNPHLVPSGPVGEEFGDWYEVDYRSEYWPDDPEMLARPAELVAFLNDANIPRRVKRDAIRTLRGRILRTELYALDGTERQDRPYTVTEHLHSVREEQAPPGPQ